MNIIYIFDATFIVSTTLKTLLDFCIYFLCGIKDEYDYGRQPEMMMKHYPFNLNLDSFFYSAIAKTNETRTTCSCMQLGLFSTSEPLI